MPFGWPAGRPLRINCAIRRRMVEGYRRFHPQSLRALIANLDNSDDGRFDIFKQNPCRHTQSRNVLRTEIVGPRGILAGSVDAVVCRTIDFDSQPDRRAIKIEYIDARWMLPTKLETAWPLPQLPPQQNFGQ